MILLFCLIWYLTLSNINQQQKTLAALLDKYQYVLGANKHKACLEGRHWKHYHYNGLSNLNYNKRKIKKFANNLISIGFN